MPFACGRPFSVHILRLHHLISLLLLWTLTPAVAQTPVANRVNAMAKSLAPLAQVVAKYTDGHRHCLYFTQANRLYRYDVVTNRREDVSFAIKPYVKIMATWLSPDGNFIFIAIDRGANADFYLDDGKELWRYDSRKQTSYKVGQGFRIWREKGCFVISRASRSLNPDAPQSKQQWMAQDHYYDLFGKVIWAKEEYRVR